MDGDQPDAAGEPVNGGETATDDRSVDALLASMRREADEQIAEVSRAADEEIRQITQRTDEILARKREAAAQALEREMAGLERRLGDEATLKARLRSLEIRNRALDSLFSEAKTRLASEAETERGREAIVRLALAAVRAVGGHGEENLAVRVPAKVTEAVTRALRDAGIAASVTPAEAGGEIVATSSDGARLVDNSLSARLERARHHQVAAIARHLFPDGAVGMDDV